MAKNVTRKPSKTLNQGSIFDAIEGPGRGVRVRVAPERRRFLPVPPRGEVIARHVEMGPEEAQAALDMSDIESKDRLEEMPIVDGFAADLAGDGWDPSGDTMVFDRRGAIIEGIKTALAIVKGGVTVRILVVVGVDPEARFSTDDTLKAAQGRRSPNAFRALPPLSDAVEVDPTLLDGRELAGVARALDLRDRVSAELGYPIHAQLTREALEDGRAFADQAARRGFPWHVALLLHACLSDAAPGVLSEIGGALALGGTVPGPVGRALRRTGARALDDMETLSVLAIAAELHADGLPDDPFEARAASRRAPAQLLKVLFGRPGRLPDRLVSCRRVRFEADRMRELLASGGRPIEGWSAEELARIDPLVRDVRRAKGLVLTGQTVKLADGDLLLDGFDRLAACLVAGRPADTFVSSGFRAGFDHLRPRGRKQNIGHRLYADGYSHPWDIQSVLGNVYRMSMDDRDADYTNTTMRHMHHLHPQVQKCVMFVHGLKDLAKISAVGTAHLAMSRYSRDLADSFASELLAIWKGRTKATIPRHEVLTALIAELDRIRVGDGDNDRTICVLLQAMDAWCREIPLGKFVDLPPTGFHRLHMPPQVMDAQEEARRIREDRKAAVAADAAPAMH